MTRSFNVTAVIFDCLENRSAISATHCSRIIHNLYMQMYVIVGCASCSGCAGCDWKRTEQWKCLFLLLLFSLFVHAQLQLPCFLLIIQSPYQNGNDACVFFMPLNCSHLDDEGRSSWLECLLNIFREKNSNPWSRKWRIPFPSLSFTCSDSPWILMFGLQQSD